MSVPTPPADAADAAESAALALETQMLLLQTTLGQLWQKVKPQEPPCPAQIVVWGATHTGQPPDAAAVAAAVRSRVWFTYRAGFEPIPRAAGGPGPLAFLGPMLLSAAPHTAVAAVANAAHFTTDVGWGCMIRTLQALLANALQTVALGRAYTYTEHDRRADGLVALFADTHSSPFSLHSFVRAAAQLPLQVKPGEWFGPSAASLAITRLCDRYVPGPVAKIHVMVSETGDLYDSEVRAHFARRAAGALLVLLPVRLGIDNVNPYYHASLFQLLASPHSVGIAGGKPASSYYFFGFLDSELLYLDPHQLQAVSSDNSTYRTSTCQALSVSALDPSMLIGLVLRDMDDYRDLASLLAGSNKIVHFHSEPPRHKATEDEEYVRVAMPELEGELVDDFVNVSDHVSDTDCGLVEALRTLCSDPDGPRNVSSGKLDSVGDKDAT